MACVGAVATEAIDKKRGALLHSIAAIFILTGGSSLLADAEQLVDVCSNEDLSLACASDEIIMMTSAQIGRKDVGRCIPKSDPFMGCFHDILPEADSWCSGKQSCYIEEPNDRLEGLNTECLTLRKTYIEATFDCVKVQAPCSSSGRNVISDSEGFLSSSGNTLLGCGSPGLYWKISADPGQTVNLTLLDFASSRENGNIVNCNKVYGYVLERSLGINHTICGGGTREVSLYDSKTNNLEIHITLPSGAAEATRFALHYKSQGCQDLTPPKDTWYKRDGNEAVIGCESTDQQWELTCSGNTWHGAVGNCSGPTGWMHKGTKADGQFRSHPFQSMLVVTAIVGGAIAVIAIALLCGYVHLKNFRRKQEAKNMQFIHATINRKSTKSAADYRSINNGHENPYAIRSKTHYTYVDDEKKPLSASCECLAPRATGERENPYIKMSAKKVRSLDDDTLPGPEECPAPLQASDYTTRSMSFASRLEPKKSLSIPAEFPVPSTLHETAYGTSPLAARLEAGKSRPGEYPLPPSMRTNAYGSLALGGPRMGGAKMSFAATCEFPTPASLNPGPYKTAITSSALPRATTDKFPIPPPLRQNAFDSSNMVLISHSDAAKRLSTSCECLAPDPRQQGMSNGTNYSPRHVTFSPRGDAKRSGAPSASTSRQNQDGSNYGGWNLTFNARMDHRKGSGGAPVPVDCPMPPYSGAETNIPLSDTGSDVSHSGANDQTPILRKTTRF